MRLTVAIPTPGQSRQVARLLAHLELQHRTPDEVIISAPYGTQVELPETARFPISVVFGEKGSSPQRNAALNHALARSDIITLLDNDFVPADDYLELVVRAFEAHEDWAAVMGRVVRDGANNAGLTWHDAMMAFYDSEREEPGEPQVTDCDGAYDIGPKIGIDFRKARCGDSKRYSASGVSKRACGSVGCNISVRSSFVGNLRFDERLVLYGLQEDVDFTSRLGRRGRVVGISNIRGVHLGLKEGRASGERFGYSQIVNPLYLIRKGTVPATFALSLIGRNIIANIVRSLWPEPYVDRRGRLRGNLLALAHVMTGRIEPEYILKI